MAFKMKGFSAFTKDKKYKYNKQGKIIGVENVPSFGDKDYKPTELDEFYDEEKDPENLFKGSGDTKKNK